MSIGLAYSNSYSNFQSKISTFLTFMLCSFLVRMLKCTRSLFFSFFLCPWKHKITGLKIKYIAYNYMNFQYSQSAQISNSVSRKWLTVRLIYIMTLLSTLMRWKKNASWVSNLEMIIVLGCFLITFTWQLLTQKSPQMPSWQGQCLCV